MKSRKATPTTRRLVNLFAGVLAIALLAALVPLGSGVTVAEEGEKLDAGLVNQGRGLYRAWCQTCHGESAKGDGPMAEYLSPKPQNLTLLSQKDGGQFYFGRVRAKIDGREKVRGHGSKDMPIWGEAFRVIDEEGGEEAVREKINALTHYLASIQAHAGDS